MEMKNSMQEETLDLSKLIGVVKRNLNLVLVFAAAGAILGILVSLLLTPRFRSSSTLNIQASYFRMPLVSDFVSELHDPAEQTTQRLSIVRMALSESFLDELGEKYRFFSGARDDKERVLERELLSSNINFFSTSRGSFQVTVIGDSATKAQEMNRDILHQIRRILVDRRVEKLESTRNSIVSHLSVLDTRMKESSSPKAILRSRLSALERQIETQAARYTADHPSVVDLQVKASALRKVLSESEKKVIQFDGNVDQRLQTSTQESFEDLFADLVRKRSYLDIAIELEKDADKVEYLSVVQQPSLPLAPIFPKKILFLGLGACAGLLVALLLTAYREFSRPQFSSPQQLADSLGIELLGELPLLDGKEQSPTQPPSQSRSIALRVEESAANG
jgi:capsular polysaccharide biosynthesis protein